MPRMCAVSWKFMKFAISLISVLSFLLHGPLLASASSFEKILKQAAAANGVLPAEQLYENSDEPLAQLGKVFFESEDLSLNGKISCKSCHLKQFSSADGIPNAVGIGGKGEGRKRALGGGRIIPRNTLPLWGRGAHDFNVLFWDGKVDFSKGKRISQFGDDLPSSDPLVIAVHLPTIEIGEMMTEDQTVTNLKKETTESASQVYQLIVEKFRKHDKGTVAELAKNLGKEEPDVEFIDVARAIASFIKSEFRIKSTKFQSFLFKDGKLTDGELKGGLIFFGKGKCSNCHSGPFFTDFDFHAIPFPQLGFGKNGFGIDYGRFNVTLEPGDLYKFRTPPLHNVAKTGPYGHSGSLKTLQEAIIYHFDPLKIVKPQDMDKLERHEYYKRLAISSKNILHMSYLNDGEVEYLVEFLDTLSFN